MIFLMVTQSISNHILFTSPTNSNSTLKNLRTKQRNKMAEEQRKCPRSVSEESMASVESTASYDSMDGEISWERSKVEETFREVGRLRHEINAERRRSKDLHEQLEEERFFYRQEKEHFLRLPFGNSQNPGDGDAGSMMLRQRLDEKERTVSKLRDDLLHRDRTIYELCVKFFRMKSTKDTLLTRLKEAEGQCMELVKELQKVTTSAIKDDVASQTSSDDISEIPDARLKQMTQRNRRLHHENCLLRADLRRLQLQIQRHCSATINALGQADEQDSEEVSFQLSSVENIVASSSVETVSDRKESDAESHGSSFGPRAKRTSSLESICGSTAQENSHDTILNTPVLSADSLVQQPTRSFSAPSLAIRWSQSPD